ncbi:MAG: hypothetical protein NTW32_17650 [Chloroflexi bacterium]|nr:hypothetical protein [Chloroflexota bacterium]
MITNQFSKTPASDSQRVLFVNHGSLLDEGVMCLVGAIPELEVMKVDYAGDELIARDITAACPDVVMIIQEKTGKLGALYRFLTSKPELKKLRMIVFHSNDNFVDIFSQKPKRAIPSQDFLAILQGPKPFSNLSNTIQRNS